MKRRTYLTGVMATGIAISGTVAGDEHEDESSNETESQSGLVGTFDDFESMDEWGPIAGSIDADSDVSVRGSQSASLTPDDEGHVRVRRELDETIDIRSAVPGLTMTSDHGGTVLLQLHDDDGDYVEYRQRVEADTPLVRHNFGLSRVRGDPDLSEVRIVQIVRWFGEDVDGELQVDDVHFVPAVESGNVMLQFHGGYETQYTQGLTRLQEYGHPATVFLATDRVRPHEVADGDRLTEDQIAELANAGWTIGSYPARGLRLDEVDSEGLEADIVDPVDWLAERGYGDGVRAFAFPGSRYDEESYELVSEHYDLAFAGQAPAQGYAGNPHLCSVVSNPDPDDAVALLDWTAEYGGITSIAFYRLEDDEAIEAVEETVEHLDELVSAEELNVLTPDEMSAEYVYEDFEDPSD